MLDPLLGGDDQLLLKWLFQHESGQLLVGCSHTTSAPRHVYSSIGYHGRVRWNNGASGEGGVLFGASHRRPCRPGVIVVYIGASNQPPYPSVDGFAVDLGSSKVS